jgi:hypothetical protein
MVPAPCPAMAPVPDTLDQLRHAQRSCPHSALLEQIPQSP